MLFQLPDLCLANIAEQLCVTSTPIETLHTSITLCKMSPSIECNLMVAHMNNFLDPGCVDELNAKVEKRAIDMKMLNDIVADAVYVADKDYSRASLAALKEECIQKKIPKTGTKAKLVDNLNKITETRARYAKIVLTKLRPISTKMSPLRPNVRTCLLNQPSPSLYWSNSNGWINSTAARSMGADEFMLDGLYHRSQLGPYACHVRLFIKSDLVQALFKRDGPGTLNKYIQDANAMLKSAPANEKKEIAKSKILAERTAEIEQFLSEFELPISYEDAKFAGFDVIEFINGNDTLWWIRETKKSVFERLVTMMTELAKFNCTIYALCSSPCESFVKRDNGSPLEIAKEMYEMKFYYDHTNYSSIYDEMFIQLRNHQYPRHKNTERNTRRIGQYQDITHLCENAKKEALVAFIQSFPTVSLAIASTDVPEKIRKIMEETE